MDVVILSVCDNADDRAIILKESADKWGYQLVFLGTDQPWISNTYRLKIILDYLIANVNNTNIYLIVDAYDVGMTGSAKEAREKFDKLQADLVFSGEANYALWEKRLRNYYWNYYPNRFTSDYPFLNAGTMMGTGAAIIQYLKLIFSLYELEIENIDSMKRIKSDQYLITRFFVDYVYGTINFPYTIKLDDQQYLFGCTGGRTSIFEWPVINKKQDYRFFYFERRFVKTFKIKNSQNLIRDFYFDTKSERITHKKNQNKPILLHIPGSLAEFPVIWNSLHENYKNNKAKYNYIFVSLLAYLRSAIDVVIAFPFRLVRKKSLTNLASAPNINEFEKYKIKIDSLFQNDQIFEHFSKEKKKIILPFLPYFLYKLKQENFVIFTSSKNFEIWSLFGFNNSNCLPNEDLLLNKEKNIFISNSKKLDYSQLQNRNGKCLIFPEIESYISLPESIWKYYPREMPISL